MKIELSQVFTQIIAFIIMLWVLKRYAWKPILKTLDERRNNIRYELLDIERQEGEIDKIKSEYLHKLREIDSYAKGKTKEAIDHGAAMAEQIRQQAHEEAKEIITKARNDLEKEIAKAKEQLKKEMVDITMSAAEKVLSTTVDKSTQHNLVKQFIDEASAK